MKIKQTVKRFRVAIVLLLIAGVLHLLDSHRPNDAFLLLTPMALFFSFLAFLKRA